MQASEAGQEPKIIVGSRFVYRYGSEISFLMGSCYIWTDQFVLEVLVREGSWHKANMFPLHLLIAGNNCFPHCGKNVLIYIHIFCIPKDLWFVPSERHEKGTLRYHVCICIFKIHQIFFLLATGLNSAHDWVSPAKTGWYLRISHTQSTEWLSITNLSLGFIGFSYFILYPKKRRDPEYKFVTRGNLSFPHNVSIYSKLHISHPWELSTMKIGLFEFRSPWPKIVFKYPTKCWIPLTVFL